MRNPNKPNSANYQLLRNPSLRSRSFLSAIPAIALMAAVCGCSKMALQDQANFKPIPQPRSLAERDQQSVDQILQRQDEVRLAAKKAEEEAAAEAKALAAQLTEQKEEIVSEAASRAEALADAAGMAPADFGIAQVSYQSEIDPTEPKTETSAVDAAPMVDEQMGSTQEVAQFELATENGSTEPASGGLQPFESNVRLTASIDDLEGVPFNSAREELDFSTANLLRPSNENIALADTFTVEAPPAPIPSQEATDITPPPFIANLDSRNLPLRPMLFNPQTRTKNTTVEGTLRPLITKVEEPEPEVAVEKTQPEIADVDSGQYESQSFGPLAPMPNAQPATAKLETPRDQAVASSATFSSRLLQPIERAVEEVSDFVASAEKPLFIPPRTPSVAPVNFEVAENPANTETTETVDEEAPPTPVFVSEQIIVIDPPAKKVAVKAEPQNEFVAAPFKANPPIALSSPIEIPKPIKIDEYVPKKAAGPIVDESLARASASYLMPKPTQIKVTEEAFIPTEVFEDAAAVAEDLERELTAAAIPVGPIEAPNDFKVRATSNTTATEPCATCDSETCTGCETETPITQPVHTDRGEPLFQNNDFAAPESPGGEFIPPMTVTPAEVPAAIPTPMPAASADFGNPVDLQAPPETDQFVAHVAALPTNGFVGRMETSKVPPVGVSTLMELNAVTWKSRLDEAIELAEERLNRMNQPTDSGMVNLRLLKALRGQMEQMETSSGQLSQNESQYWHHQLEAITSMLGTPTGNNRAITDYHRHQTAHKTLEHLRNAVSQLESIATLKVSSGQFCTEITGFGQFRPFHTSVFTAGQKMLVYCEVENYRTIEHQSVTGNDFRTRLRGSFAIYDADGKVVQQAEYPTVDDVARKRRRDFYMYMPVTLGDLPTGNYVLHALVEDIHGNKTASLDPPLQFSVK